MSDQSAQIGAGLATQLAAELPPVTAPGLLPTTYYPQYRPTGTYLATDLAVTVFTWPTAPDRLICLTPQGVGDPALSGHGVINLQVRTRWADKDPRPVNILAGSIYTLWHDRSQFQAGTVRVVLAVRTSWAMLGQDTAGRWSRSDNYRLTVHVPGSRSN